MIRIISSQKDGGWFPLCPLIMLSHGLPTPRRQIPLPLLYLVNEDIISVSFQDKKDAHVSCACLLITASLVMFRLTKAKHAIYPFL